MKNIKYLILYLIVLTSACGNRQSDEQEKQESLYNEVMAIHNQVMPKMGILLSFQGKLEEEITQLDSNNTDDLKKIKFIESQINKLEEADEAMMQWMRNFRVDQEGWRHDSVMSYLENEKQAISSVSDQMQEVIAESEAILGINGVSN